MSSPAPHGRRDVCLPRSDAARADGRTRRAHRHGSRAGRCSPPRPQGCSGVTAPHGPGPAGGAPRRPAPRENAPKGPQGGGSGQTRVVGGVRLRAAAHREDNHSALSVGLGTPRRHGPVGRGHRYLHFYNRKPKPSGPAGCPEFMLLICDFT